MRCTNFSNLFLEQNSTCLGQVFCPSSGVQHCTHSNRYMSYRFCCVYNTRLLMVDRKPVRNMQSSIPKKKLRNQCISLVLLREYITMYGPLNVKFQLHVSVHIQSHLQASLQSVFLQHRTITSTSNKLKVAFRYIIA